MGPNGPGRVPGTDRQGMVVVAWNRFGPYHHARLRATAHLNMIGLEISVADDTNPWARIDGPTGFSKLEAFHNEPADTVPPARMLARLATILDGLRPAAVAVPGWGYRSALALMSVAGARGIPLVLMSDSTADDAPRRWYKELPKRRLVGLASSALVAGTPQKDYLASLGMPIDRIFLGYDIVDNAHFARGADAARQRSDELRAELALPRPFFLASARFLAMKNLFRLLEAFARYRAQAGAAAWDLVLLGDGELHSRCCGTGRRLRSRAACTFLATSSMTTCPPGTAWPRLSCSPARPRPGAWWSTRRWRRACPCWSRAAAAVPPIS